ncbi:MAG: ABC transporter permease [Roseovarius sp.]|nr:ABC transporter permease [Roseovarius sp.]MCY4316555.1 ABC transporter permease [Roseovarius sp.]
MLDMLYLSALNIRRNNRRSILTVLSIAVGCAALACFGAFISFSFEGLREITIHTQLGHMQIYRKGYWERHMSDPENAMIESVSDLDDALSGIEGVSSVAPRLTFSGIGGAGRNTATMFVMGIDPEREIEFADFEIVTDGRPLMPGDIDAGVIGSELATGLDVSVGDWVTLLASTLDGMINAVDFKVVGITRTGNTKYDSVFVKIPLGLAQSVLDTDSVERMVLLLHDTDSLEEMAPIIEEAAANLPERYETRQWKELAGFYSSVVSLYSGLFQILSGIVAVVVLFSVANTMTMAVFERTGETGALRAIGASQGVVMTMFLTEGFLTGILGGGAGVILSLGVSHAVEILGGIAMPPPPSMSQGYQAYFPMHLDNLALAFLVSVVASLASSVLPAWTASRTNIVEALQVQ